MHRHRLVRKDTQTCTDVDQRANTYTDGETHTGGERDTDG